MLPNFFMRRLQYNQQTLRFFVTMMALGFTIDGVYAVVFNLYLLRLGYDTTFIGQVNSIGLLVFAAMSLPAGIFGSWWTSSRMLRVGIGFILLGSSLLPLVEWTPQAWHEIWLILTYALILAGFSLYFVNGAPFLMGVVRRDEQNRAFAMQTALLSLAGFIGGLVGGTFPELIGFFQNLSLDDPQPYRYTLMLVALVMFIAFLVTWTIHGRVDDLDDEPREIPQTQNAHKGGFTKTIIILIGLMSLVRFLQVAGVGTASIFINVYLDTELKASTATIGTIMALARFVSIPMVLLAPRLIHRWGIGAVAVGASFSTALFLIPLAIIPHWWAAAIAYVATQSFSSLRFTAFIVYIMLLVPKHQQAVMAGAGEMAAGSSFAIMALSGGYILAAFSFRDLFLMGAGLSGLGSLIFWWHIKTSKGWER